MRSWQIFRRPESALPSFIRWMPNCLPCRFLPRFRPKPSFVSCTQGRWEISSSAAARLSPASGCRPISNVGAFRGHSIPRPTAGLSSCAPSALCWSIHVPSLALLEVALFALRRGWHAQSLRWAWSAGATEISSVTERQAWTHHALRRLRACHPFDQAACHQSDQVVSARTLWSYSSRSSPVACDRNSSSLRFQSRSSSLTVATFSTARFLDSARSAARS